MYKLIRLLAVAVLLIVVACLAMLVLAFAPLSYYVVAGLIVLYLVKRGHGYLFAYGTARWAQIDELRAAGMLNPEGIILGRLN